MKIEVLIATMFNNDIEQLLTEMNISTDCVVVNQCDCKKEEKKEIQFNGCNIKVIYSPERGLSRSRNKALQNVSQDTDIVIFTDDDIKFSDDYRDVVVRKHQENNCDGIVFNVKRANGKLNKKLTKYVNQINLFRVISVSMTFKYKSIKNISFDENFGTGSNKYILGEENIFISDCLKNKLRISTDKYIMCQIEDKRPSTWNHGMKENVLYSKGATFKRMHKYLYMIFNIDFAIRKYKRYCKDMSFIRAIRTLFNGSRDYDE